MTTDVQMNAFQEQLGVLEAEITQMAASDVGIEGFFRFFLERTSAVLAVGGGVWRQGAMGELLCLCHMDLGIAGLDEEGRQFQLLCDGVGKVFETAAPVVLPARSGSNVYDGGLGPAGTNDSAHTLLFVPVIVANKVSAVVVLISPENVEVRAVRGYLGFVMGLCNKAGAFMQNKRIVELEGQLGRADRVRQYISALHSGLDPRRTCYALANYCQELLGVHRCMAGTFNSRGKFSMKSVSGLESIAVKSSFIKNISQIARQVCRNGTALIVDNPEAARSADPTDDDIVTAARLYMLQAESLVLGIFPIKWEKHVVGALIIEKAREEPIDQDERRRIDALLVEAGSSLSNSMTYRYLPLSPLTRAVGSVRDSLYRMTAVRRAFWAAVVLAVVLMPFVISRQVKVVGTAELLPVDARIAFAPLDGVVESVPCLAERRVKANTVLASLDIKLIDSDLDRINSEIIHAGLTLEEELRNNGQTPLAAVHESRLNVLQAELNKLTLQRSQYEIKSEVAGLVITREPVLRQLLSRPVMRGEPLIEVVPDATQWQLMVNVPEDEAGDLLRSYDELKEGESLTARVILNAYPDIKFETKVLYIAPRAHVLSTGEQKYRNVIEVHVAEPDDLRAKVDPRQGMKGKVAIRCGRRNLFYTVTHEFADFLRISLF